MYPRKENFDLAWQLHKGELSERPRRLTGKANASSYAADLTAEEVRPGAPLNVIANRRGDNQVSYNRLDRLGADWTTVDLPHDWRIHEPPAPDRPESLKPGFQLAYQGYYHPGIAYYRKTYYCEDLADPAVERTRLTFDGVIGRSDYWVNGFYLGCHLTGYSPVSFDITELLRPACEGPNVILVRSDTTEAEGWWYEGGGISRHVWLERHHVLSIPEHGVKITSAISGSEAEAELCIELQNMSAIDRTASISVDIISPRGETVAKLHHPGRQVLAWEEGVTVDFITIIRKPTLWNIGDGQLYSAIVHVYEGDMVVHKTPACLFGLRTVEFQQDGILVNGIRHKIRGCNIHADFVGVGVGMPDRLIEYKLELLREMGANTVRIAHHPPTPELVQHADRMGFFVIPENRSLSTAQLGFLRTLVRQFRNSPSILLWSLENEELTLQGTVTGMAILKRLVAEVKRFDPSRHTCVGGVIHLDHPYHDITSVIGIHYQGLVNTIEKVTGYFQDKPHIQDECGLHAPTRGVYTTQPGRNSEFSTISGLMPSFANMTKIPALGSGDLKARDNISTILTDVFLDSTTTGGCIWTGMDYHGEPVPTAWPSVISAYGARDLIGLPKDYYWLVRCIFKRDEPLVHTFPHWTWPGKEEERIPFRVYSNCHSVQVLVNGQTVVGKRAVEKSTAYFPEGILYTPGKLLVRGLDAAGAVVAEHQVRTAGRPHRLVLQSDRSKLAPNGDVSTIRVAVVDENGILVPTANNMIHFALEQVGHQPAGTGSPDARIIGVGNGDNAATGESEQGNQRSAFNGWAAVLVQSSQISGQVKLVARSTGLVNGQVLVDISPNAKPHAVYLARDERDGPAGTHRSFGQARAAL